MLVMNNKLGRPMAGKRAISINGKLTKAYRKWSSMIRRCSDTGKWAKYYKDQGITVCDRWIGRSGFDNFVEDMGEPPEELTLERVRNNEGYSKENCRWATWKEQAKNRRKGGRIVSNSLMNQARMAGIAYHIVYQRVKKSGWSVERALSIPNLRDQKRR